MYTYAEAKQIAEQKQLEYEKYYEDAGKPRLTQEWLKSLPEGINNVNRAARHPMFAIGESSDGRCYEYPTNVFCWGYGIPEEAFLTEEMLNNPVWKVYSYRDDFDW